jgi:GntR family transcriptional regulator
MLYWPKIDHESVVVVPQDMDYEGTMSSGVLLTAGDVVAQLSLDPRSGVPLYRQVAAGIRDLAMAGTLSAGDRLPPIRDLARALGLSHITVSQAYSVLRTDGVVDVRRGQGTVIASATSAPIHRSRAAPGLGTGSGQGEGDTTGGGGEEEEPSWPTFVRSPRGGLLQGAVALPDARGRHDTPLIHLGTGQPDAALLPLAALRRAWAAALRDASPQDLLYAGPQGDPEVRAALAGYCAGLGYAAAPEEVLITTGTQQSIDLVIRTFIQRGEHVLVESPGYPSALDLLENHGCRLVPVPVDAEGLRVDLLAGLIARFQPRLLYLAPTGHNPTGTVLSAHRRDALRALIPRANLLVLEDDVCSELLYDGRPQPGVRTARTRGHVLTLKSFAKTVLPGLRVGCLLAAPPLLHPLAATKALTDRFTSPLAQHALRCYLQGRSLQADLARAREAYRERRDVLAAELARALPAGVQWTLPAAGLNLWLTLPPGDDAAEVRRLAAERGVLCAPGPAFFAVPETAEAHLRLTFADSPPALLGEGVRRLAEAVRDSRVRQGPHDHQPPARLPLSV